LDAVSGRIPARVRGEPRWATGQGRFGGALEFDGAGNLLDCGDAAELDFRDGLSVSLWVKARDLKQGPQTIIAKGNDTWRLYVEGKSGRLVFAVNGPQPSGKERNKRSQATSKAALREAQWHHVVGAYDGQRIVLYVDGEWQEAVTAAGPVAVTTEPLWLGNNSAARNQFFGGWLDDVRLYGSGLSEDAVKALYRGDASPPPAR
jgi:beta-galactosidase